MIDLSCVATVLPIERLLTARFVPAPFADSFLCLPERSRSWLPQELLTVTVGLVWCPLLTSFIRLMFLILSARLPYVFDGDTTPSPRTFQPRKVHALLTSMRPLSAAYEGYHRPKLGAETLLDDTAHGSRETVVRTGSGCTGEAPWTR